MKSILSVFLIFWLATVIQGLVFECFGKCQCYPEFKIIQCATGYRNQLGLTSKADIDGFQVSDSELKNLKIVPEGTFKPAPTPAPWKYGRTKRDLMDKIHRFKMWLIDFRRQIQNTSRRH